jgi:DNA-3-methyladenine glycosylase II
MLIAPSLDPLRWPLKPEFLLLKGDLAPPDLARAQYPYMLVRPREPFNFARTLRFILSPPELLNQRRFDPLLDYFEEGEYRRVADIGGQLALYGVREEIDGGKTALRVRILAGAADETAKRSVVTQVERQFSTQLDLSPFYEIAKADPVLGHLCAHFCGMRIPQAPTVFETVISAILEQQVNLSFAHQVKKALIETHGGRVEFEGRRYNAFPEPAALAIVTPQELRRLLVSGPKARYIIAISRATLDGSLDLEGLRGLEAGSAHARLMEQKGVGPWTAHYVGLRALGHLDCLPAADVGLRKVLRELYGLRKQPSLARVEQLAARWSGWRSYATFYLWLTYWEDKAWKVKLLETIRRRGKSKK